MKIAIITSLYKPYHRGGVEVITQNLVSQLQQQGHDVFVITNGYEDVAEKVDDVMVYRISKAGIANFIDLPEKSLPIRAVWHIYDALQKTNAQKVVEIIKDEKPDLVLSHNIKGIGIQSLIAVQKAGIPVIHTIHDIQYAIPSGLLYWGKENDKMVKNPYTFLYTQLYKFLLYQIEVIVSPSEWLKKFYQEKGVFKKQPVTVLRNPVAPNQPYYSKEFDYTYCYIGQIEEHKGIRLLLESFDIFQDKHPEAKLLVVGEGSLLNDLKQQYGSEKWVKFTGRIEYEQLSEKIFPLVSYSILPSLVYENSPGTVYDAYANSTPVIVPDIGGSAELVIDGETGFVFEPGSHKGLIAVLEKTVANKDRYAWMAMKARSEIEKYTFEEYFKQLGIK